MSKYPPREAADLDREMTLLARLRRMVLSGEYPPGAPLRETFLAAEFDVSRTPIREALKQLENEGLVEIRSRVGSFVRNPTRRDILELFELKEGLEGLAANLLARRGDEGAIAYLRSNIEQSRIAEREHDTRRYATQVLDFHWTIINAADNRKLVEHYQRLMNQLAYRRLVLKTSERPGRIAASNREHESVLDAIEARDPLGAELALRHHVRISSEVLLSINSPAAKVFETASAVLDDTNLLTPAADHSQK